MDAKPAAKPVVKPAKAPALPVLETEDLVPGFIPDNGVQPLPLIVRPPAGLPEVMPKQATRIALTVALAQAVVNRGGLFAVTLQTEQDIIAQATRLTDRLFPPTP